MLYQLYETQRSLMEPFADFAQAAAKLYSNPLSPFGQNQLSQRISASYDLLHDRLVLMEKGAKGALPAIGESCSGRPTPE